MSGTTYTYRDYKGIGEYRGYRQVDFIESGTTYTYSGYKGIGGYRGIDKSIL